MSTIIKIIQMLPGMEYSSPARKEEIKRAEEKLRLKFADEYKEYLSAFGAVASDVIALSGISTDQDYHVVSLTNQLRAVHTEIPADFYAIEDVGADGLAIWQNQTGAVFQSLPYSQPARIFRTLADFLRYQLEE